MLAILPTMELRLDFRENINDWNIFFSFQFDGDVITPMIEIIENIIDDEKTRFEYMINYGIDIKGFKPMTYEKFVETLLEKIAENAKIL